MQSATSAWGHAYGCGMVGAMGLMSVSSGRPGMYHATGGRACHQDSFGGWSDCMGHPNGVAFASWRTSLRAVPFRMRRGGLQHCCQSQATLAACCRAVCRALTRVRPPAAAGHVPLAQHQEADSITALAWCLLQSCLWCTQDLGVLGAGAPAAWQHSRLKAGSHQEAHPLTASTCSLRDTIRRAVARDRLSVLVIAMESALLDNRHQVRGAAASVLPCAPRSRLQ